MKLPDLGRRIEQRCLTELDHTAHDAWHRDPLAYDRIVADELQALA